ncbi:MAG: RagB/SusD family nutrient uptake outer membrane protein [Bacteroidota bacterium]
MENTFKYIWLVVITIVFFGCDLTQVPEDTASKSSVFGSEKGLELYSYSFYDFLPSANNIHTCDAISDYAARRDAPVFLRPGAYDANTTDITNASGYSLVALGEDWNWEWGHLRNFNYFIENCDDPGVPVEVRNHYLGLAKFFRAFFYFEKVKRYGDVPWIGKALDVADPDLYKARDSRVMVMDSILADLDFAYENISTTNDETRSLITKWVALALKSRVCLFEGTFRKYHPEFGLPDSDEWINEAVNASKMIMDESGFSIYTGDGPDMSYRKLFTSNSPVAEEIMLAANMNEDFAVTHSANWYYTSTTTGIRFNFIRTFINTYLNIDGTPFTDNPGYETMEFQDEVKGRDKRLQQTIRMGDYKRISGGALLPTPPDMDYSYTGYHPIKWSLDDMNVDTRDLNTNAVSIFRYAEVLLNYSEAKAELGTLTDADWAATVGLLRARAGITSGLSTKPSVVDSYMQSKYFPEISDPSLLEIRRERGIELCFEGLRFYDIIRWAKGELFEMEWNGIYVPALDTPLDLNEDGSPEVVYFKVEPATRLEGVIYINVSETSGGIPNPYRLSNDNSGEITWLNTTERKWDDKKYFYPIPEFDRLANPKLGQNPDW